MLTYQLLSAGSDRACVRPEVHPGAGPTPAYQDRLLRLAGFCARLADDAESEPGTGVWSEHDQAA
jgi:hypothetical protein